MSRAYILTRTQPSAPVYVVLDAGLQESSLETVPDIPDMSRHQPPGNVHAAPADIAAIADMLKGAERPVILFGRGSRKREDWDARVKLAEATGACVMTDLKLAAVFPTDHPAHVIEPYNQAGKVEREIIADADLILALEWVDAGGLLCAPNAVGNTHAKIVQVSLDHHLHNGAHSVYQLMSPADLRISASSDAVVADLNATLGAGSKKPWRDAVKKNRKGDPDRITMVSVCETLRGAVDDPDEICLAAVSRGWPCEMWPHTGPHAYMGKDGGGGIGSGPSISIGVALANDDAGRKTVAVLGDGDFMMGGHAIYTAVKHKIPLLVLINNNQSYFNDELHQETVAKRRNRPVSNRWIGQAMTDPILDIAKFVEAQGATGIGPVTDPKDLQAAIEKGVAVLNAGGVAVVDIHVPPGDRGTASTGLRNT